MRDRAAIIEKARKAKLAMLDDMVDLDSYDHFIVFFSGGKDSLACFLHLLDLGVPKEKIELWHHEIDGREGSTLMDWPCTGDYCRKVAKAFGVPIYFSWRENGFEGELNKGRGDYSYDYMYEDQDLNVVRVPLDRKRVRNFDGRVGFPQQSMDLGVRWCSGHLKIDVASRVITHQQRFNGKRVLTISGERGEESKGRAKMTIYGPDKPNSKTKRHVYRWRCIRDWLEQDVWEIIERYKVHAHPCYYLGFGRCSCAACVFANKNQLASLLAINPGQLNVIADYETKFGKSIDRSGKYQTFIEKAKAGRPYDGIQDKQMVKLALSKTYTGKVFIENWKLPSGAFGENAGPT